jgi:hypothetical protein
MATGFKLTVLTVPPGLQCLTTTQAVLDAAAKYLQIVGPTGTSFIIISDTEPSVDDRDKAWLKLEENGKPIGLYKFQDAAWMLVPGVHQGAIILYSGAVASIPAGWQLADGTNGSPDLTNDTNYASLWQPNYNGATTTYDLCPIWFKGHAS